MKFLILKNSNSLDFHFQVRYYCPNVPIILVGNKADLRTDPNIIKELELSNEKPVDTERGKQVAEQINAFAYLECSAKTKQVKKTDFDLD